MVKNILGATLALIVAFTGCHKNNPAEPDIPEIPYNMVAVGDGTFQMGSDKPGFWASPIHSVTVNSYYLEKWEVTYEKWSEVRDWALTHGYKDLGDGTNGSSPTGTNNPVGNVQWYDAVKWCNARSEKEGLMPVYYSSIALDTVYRSGNIDLTNGAVRWLANGYRLPTEAEWEFAALGGTKSNHSMYAGSNAIDSVAWYDGNSIGTHTVGQKKANELGLFDMLGNVWEFCWDRFEPYSNELQIDPKGPEVGVSRAIRGASFLHNPPYCQPQFRGGLGPDGRSINVGFRCCRSSIGK